MDERGIKKFLEKEFKSRLPDGRVMIKGKQVFFFTGEFLDFQNADYGLQIGILEKDGIRPTIDLCQFSEGDFIELSKQEAMQWMCGLDLKKEAGKGRYVILRYGKYILGAGKPRNGKILNFLPKNRRLPLRKLS